MTDVQLRPVSEGESSPEPGIALAPNGAIPAPPKGVIPAPPKGVIPAPSNGAIPGSSKGAIPASANGAILAPSNGAIPAPPKAEQAYALGSGRRPMGYLPPGFVDTFEPDRGSGIGVFTGHRLFVVAWLSIISVALFLFQEWLWPSAVPSGTWLGKLWEAGSLIWITPLLPGAVGLIGLLWYRHPDDLDTVSPISQLVVLRIVTRGTNPDALRHTISRCRREMAATPMFRYLIEVVTDTAGPWSLGTNDVVQLVVPHDYVTPARSLYKARALHYAVEHSTIPADAWIVHHDEETQLTSSGIKGIAKMIREEEAAGTMRIGQGAILYHRDWEKHPFLTMADNIRTGDDFGRFYFQHRLGRTIFGMHGSYIVCRNEIAREIGFDFGPNGSITEDAFWALVAMENGHRARWVEGYLEEQSTQSAKDFMRQRRRWFQGLWKVSLHAPVQLRYRAVLLMNSVLWACVPLSLLYTTANLIVGSRTPLAVQILANLAWAQFVTLYFVGMKTNLDEHDIRNPIKRLGWYIAQGICLPFCATLESASVLLAIVRPHSGFQVVKK
jgi:beta-1,4-mannosyltransferase